MRRSGVKPKAMSKLDHIRRHFGELFAAHANSPDPRIADIVASTPREDFVGPGPWTISVNPWDLTVERRVPTPSADPTFLYSNCLVALDDERNNGEPFLHAAWIGKVRPGPGEIVTHIGAGTGYYTAILAKLVQPRGEVFAFEIDTGLATRAVENLGDYDNVTVGHADAVTAQLPPSDLIYVNAGVVAPPVSWIKALRPDGRLIFPWRPAGHIGLAVIVTRRQTGLAVNPFMGSWFIPCIGASVPGREAKLPTSIAAKRSRSLWLTAERAPDTTATAVFDGVWFSSERIDRE